MQQLTSSFCLKFVDVPVHAAFPIIPFVVFYTVVGSSFCVLIDHIVAVHATVYLQGVVSVIVYAVVVPFVCRAFSLSFLFAISLSILLS